jgi:hypothetical protein
MQHRHSIISSSAADVSKDNTSSNNTNAISSSEKKLKRSRYAQYRNTRNGYANATTVTTSLVTHGNRYYSHRPRSRKRRSYYTIRRSYVVTCLMCFIVLLCVILMITHTLGIRLMKQSHPIKSLLGKQIPYPSSDIQISVILMNHARPYILQQSQLLRTLVTHPNVQTIYILHSNPLTKFNNEQLIPHLVRKSNETITTTTVDADPRTLMTPTVSLLNSKIQHIDAVTLNEQMGLAIRFHYCAVLCRGTPYVLHLDDDMEFTSHSVINTLIQSMIQNPHRIVGHYGRAYNEWAAPFRHGYDTKDIYGNVEVVLTKILLLEQVLCQEFFKYTYLVNDVMNRTSDIVKWNGEDIFINLVANHYYHVPMYGPYNNYAIAELDVWDVDTSKMLDHSDHPDGTTALEPLPQQQLRRNNNNNNNNIDNKKDNIVLLENAVSGNMDRNRIWNVGFYQWYVAYQKAQAHTKYRGLLWYTTKQRLYKLQ